jgi:hypothetical protein
MGLRYILATVVEQNQRVASEKNRPHEQNSRTAVRVLSSARPSTGG